MLPLRVLVVDDVPAVASLHATFVRAHGACELVGTASTGPQAVQLVRELQPDLVLLDVFLPVHSGIEALRAIRSDTAIRQPEVIAVTAARDIDTVRTARLIGARHYLVKPFAAKELHQRIDDVLRERAALPSEGTPLAQTDVDAVMRPPERPSLPKGLTADSLELVLAGLARLGNGSAAEVAAEIGLSRVSCRRYLEHLVETGVATRTLDYLTSGRPSARYRVAEDEHA